MKIALCGAMLTLGVSLFATAHAAIYYIRTNGNDALRGISWVQAKQALGNAIASASDKIWVARGTYAERITQLDGYTVTGGIGPPLGGHAKGNARGEMGAFEFWHSTADSDGDGMKDADKVMAGTNPADPVSVLKLSVRLDETPNTLLLNWPSAVGRLYQLEARSPITSTNAWQVLTNDLPGNASVAQWTVSPLSPPERTFRVQVRRP